MKTEKKNLRRISIVVTAQTKGNLERLAAVCGYSEIGRVVDKLTREKMISFHDFERKRSTTGTAWSGLWRKHSLMGTRWSSTPTGS